MKYFIAGLVSFLLAQAAFAAQSPIIGVWETERKEDENKAAHIKIEACKGNPTDLCGHIVWLEEPNDPETGKPKLDKMNSDESKQKQPVKGMQMMWHFKPANSALTKYTDGEIYSSHTGKTYNGDMELVNQNTLALTGYVMFFWKTQNWKRVK